MKPERAVEMTGAWKTRKTKPRFPFVFPSPWKSLRDSHIPTAPAMFVFPGKTNPKTQERSPAERASELHPFRLILGLENARTQEWLPTLVGVAIAQVFCAPLLHPGHFNRRALIISF